VETCVFRLSDQAKWKGMSPDGIASVTTPDLVMTTPVMPHLMGNTLDPVALSNDLEKEMRALIIQHRKVRRKRNDRVDQRRIVRLRFGLHDAVR
jgi:hypothetical protein